MIAKKLHLKGLLATIFTFLIGLTTINAQIYNPVSWSTEVRQTADGMYDLLVHATIDKGWHLYSQTLPSDDGPIATEFTFPKGGNYTLIGKVSEPEPLNEYDPNFDMELSYFKDKVTFVQKIETNSLSPINFTAEVYFMVCDEEKCLPPEYVDLEFQIDVPEGELEERAEPSAQGSENELAEQEQDPQSSSSSSSEASAENESSIPGNEDEGILEPVKWEYFSKKVDEGTYELHFKASIEEGWHLYSQFLESDEGPIATGFYFEKSDFEAIGKVEERGERITEFDKVFEMKLSYFEDVVDFVQTIKTDQPRAILEFEFMACNDSRCLTPAFNEIVFDLESGTGMNALDMEGSATALEESGVIPNLPNVDLEEPLGQCGEDRAESSSLWLVFLLGFGGGLIALLTPCVFPMIPLTVSFFTKGDGTEGSTSKGLGKAVLYGFFIFLIYAVLSIPFHFNTDPGSAQ